jgi:hypothetical protein
MVSSDLSRPLDLRLLLLYLVFSGRGPTSVPSNNKLAQKRKRSLACLKRKSLVEEYMSRYNQERWHSALDCRIRMAFAAVRDAGGANQGLRRS